MAVMDWREQEQLKRTRQALIEHWSSGRPDTPQTGMMIGLIVGAYVPQLIETAEFWRNEAGNIRRRLDELKARMPEPDEQVVVNS